MGDINWEAFARTAVRFIRERGLEADFVDWGGGWPIPWQDHSSSMLDTPPLPADLEAREK